MSTNNSTLPNNYSGQVAAQSDSNQDQQMVSAGQPGSGGQGGYMPQNTGQPQMETGRQQNLQPQDLNASPQSMQMVQQPYMPQGQNMSQTPQNQSSLMGTTQSMMPDMSGGYQPSTYPPSGNNGNGYLGGPPMSSHQMMQPFGQNPMQQAMQPQQMASSQQNTNSNSMQANNQMNQQINNKYKTQRCWHFDNGGNCSMAEKCHFAHGDDELRESTQPIPYDLLPQAQRRVPSGLQGRGGKTNRIFNDRGGRGGGEHRGSEGYDRRGGGESGRGNYRGGGERTNQYNNLNSSMGNESRGGGHQGYQPNMNAGIAGGNPAMGGNDLNQSPSQRGAFRKMEYSRGGASLRGGDRPQYQKYGSENNTFNGNTRGGGMDRGGEHRGRGGRGGGAPYIQRGGMEGSSRGGMQGSSRGGDAKSGGYQGRGGYSGATQATTPAYSAGGGMGAMNDGNSPSLAADAQVNNVVNTSSHNSFTGINSNVPQQMPTPFQYSASPIGSSNNNTNSNANQFMGFSNQNQQNQANDQNNAVAGQQQQNQQQQQFQSSQNQLMNQAQSLVQPQQQQTPQQPQPYQGGFSSSQNNDGSSNSRGGHISRGGQDNNRGGQGDNNRGNWGGSSRGGGDSSGRGGYQNRDGGERSGRGGYQNSDGGNNRDQQQQQQMNLKQNNPNYKTDMCKFFEQRKQCPYQSRCSFAHGKKELRPKPPMGQGQQPGEPGQNGGSNYQQGFIPGGSSSYAGGNSRGGSSAGGFTGGYSKHDNNGVVGQNPNFVGLNGASGYSGMYAAAGQAPGGAQGLYQPQNAFQSDLLMGVHGQQPAGGPAYFSNNGVSRQANPNYMVEGSALMVTGSAGPMQSQQSQLLSMYVNNVSQGHLQQQQVTMLMHDQATGQVYKKPLTICLTQAGSANAAQINAQIQNVADLCEQGKSSEAEQILDALQAQQLIQIQDTPNGANFGQQQQHLVDNNETSNEIMNSSSPIGQQME